LFNIVVQVNVSHDIFTKAKLSCLSEIKIKSWVVFGFIFAHTCSSKIIWYFLFKLN